jgi:hypothetical protein
VPLRDVSVLLEWSERDAPLPGVWTIVEARVLGLATVPWLYPSTPFEELSFQPDFETRSAIVPASDGIEVFYTHDYATDLI